MSKDMPAIDPRPAALPFRAVLRPHRSLGRVGFIVLMSLVGVVSFAAGMAFLLMGAWPVFGFFGLDAVLIYCAFRLNYRSARAMETVELTPETLRVTRISASGAEERLELNPYFVRLRFHETPDGRTHLALAAHGSAHPLGRFLSDEERRGLAAALDAGLLAARGGVRI